METIFTKIINREILAEIIYENDYLLVIPDKSPSMYGQLVVIAKKQVSYIFELSDKEYLELMLGVKMVALALDNTLKTKRTCFIVEGFETPHVHVRVYPCFEDNIILEPRTEVSNEELKALADKVRSAI